MAYDYTIKHGEPKHDYFSILQPCYRRGGLDCLCHLVGIGVTHTLVNPTTQETIRGKLILRRMLYTDNDVFEAIAYTIYGFPGAAVIEQMQRKYEDMITEVVEIWTFKKER